MVVERGITGLLVNNALERAWKEAVVAEFWCPGIAQKGRGNPVYSLLNKKCVTRFYNNTFLLNCALKWKAGAWTTD